MRNFLIVFMLFVTVVTSAQQRQMTLEDAIWGRYTYLRPKTMYGLAWKNDKVFSFVESDTLWSIGAMKNRKKPIICSEILSEIIKGEKISRFPQYSWLENGKLLVKYRKNYAVVDLDDNKLSLKIKLPKTAQNEMFVEKGKYVAYTNGDNIFVAFSDNKIEQITYDGGEGIVNGKTVHRNEFGINKGIFNSPKGNYIAFYRKDETMVTDYPLVDYMDRKATYKPLKYPMAGMKSHYVKIGIYNVESKKTIFLNTEGDPEHFLTNISWAPNEKFIYVAELNREQNHMCLNEYNVLTGEKVKTLVEETNNKYVEPLYPIIFSKVNKNIFYFLDRRDGWFHVYKYDTDGKLIKQITKGEWEVTQILGFDENEKYLFVETTKETPLERHLYRVDVKSGKMVKLSNEAGVHSGMLSPNASWIIDRFSAPDIPYQVNLISQNGKRKVELDKSQDPLGEYELGKNNLVKITAADGKTELTGRLILPVNFDSTKKYPVIVYVYGGPHSQMVLKSWHNAARWWQYYMASKGFISFTMDNRGTSNRGRDFETAIHRNLGLLETDDQMKGIEYLKGLPFVDGNRIGVHGWSYGGFMTLNLMLRHPEVFKVGVAGGPVVDWSLYEIMYGERYMDTPQENPDGYKETNMINHVSNLKGKLMLIHGVQDNVVVMQHSMMFLRECVKQGKQVDFFVYPTHPHNVGGKDRIHLMDKVSLYFLENL